MGVLTASPAFSVGETAPPQLQSLRFSPESLTTTSTPEVTVTFTASDDDSGLVYFETGFVDPSGTIRDPVSVRFAPARSATGSVRITLPQFPASGTWTLSHVLLCDAAGNTSLLDAHALRRQRFPTRLDVTSLRDTEGPKLTALDFAPARIDTSVRPAEVNLNYAVTDDLSGVRYIELAFRSPSGTIMRGSARLELAQSFSGSIPMRFPVLSEAGQWALSSIFLLDGAGNTLALDAPGIVGRGFRTELEVKSTADTVAPRLTALRFAPQTINTSANPQTVAVAFTVTDDLSGVRSVEFVFESPSGIMRQSGSAIFSPDTALSSSIDVQFPQSSESGRWTLRSVFLSDASGNTRAVDADRLSELGFEKTLQVESSPDTISPALAALNFAPDTIDVIGGPATVKVEYTVTDNLSGVKSIELVFVSPSGSKQQHGSALFSAANVVTNSVEVTFPQASEWGRWTLTSVVLSDAAGNTLVLDEVGLARLGFPLVVDVMRLK